MIKLSREIDAHAYLVYIDFDFSEDSVQVHQLYLGASLFSSYR